MNYIVLTVRDCNIPKFRRVSEIDSENHLESKFRKYNDVFIILTNGHVQLREQHNLSHRRKVS